MNLKDRAGQMSSKEAAQLISQQAMLLKRPLLISEEKVLVGFSPKEYENLIE